MRAPIRRKFLSFMLMMIYSVCTAKLASAQLNDGAIIIPEFFEELYEIGSAGGATDLLNSPTFETLFGHHLAIYDENTAYVTSFSDLYRFNFTTGQLTFVDELSFNPLEITVDTNGDLIAVEAGELFRIDPATGAETSIYTETFFGPFDAVAAAGGNLFVTEFFDAVGVVNSAGVFSKIGNFPANEFRHLDLGPDGMLYLSTTVGGSFYRIDPTTGFGTALDSDVFTVLDDLQVDASGDIIFSGEVDAKAGIFRFDPATDQLTTIIDETSFANDLFNPLDVAIFSSDQDFANADFDHDGDVDSADLTHLLDAYSHSSAGDIDGDGDTDGADVLAWQNQFTDNAGLAASVVPEPCAAVLLLLAAGCSCCPHRARV